MRFGIGTRRFGLDVLCRDFGICCAGFGVYSVGFGICCAGLGICCTGLGARRSWLGIFRRLLLVGPDEHLGAIGGEKVAQVLETRERAAEPVQHALGQVVWHEAVIGLFHGMAQDLERSQPAGFAGHLVLVGFVVGFQVERRARRELIRGSPGMGADIEDALGISPDSVGVGPDGSGADTAFRISSVSSSGDRSRASVCNGSGADIVGCGSIGSRTDSNASSGGGAGVFDCISSCSNVGVGGSGAEVNADVNPDIRSGVGANGADIAARISSGGVGRSGASVSAELLFVQAAVLLVRRKMILGQNAVQPGRRPPPSLFRTHRSKRIQAF